MALEDARLAADPHSMRLIPIDALEMTSREMRTRKAIGTGIGDALAHLRAKK